MACGNNGMGNRQKQGDDSMAGKIIINGRFLTRRITGVERYAGEILGELDKLVTPGTYMLAVPCYAENVPRYGNIETVRVGRLGGIAWEQVSLPRYVAGRKGMLLNLCNTAPFRDPGIVCVHDMKVRAKPEFFGWKFRIWYLFLFRNIFCRARAVLTVSEFSRSEILKYYPHIRAKTYVIPNGWQHYQRIGHDEKCLARYGLEPGNYYFSMGSLEKNKNFRWVLEVACRNRKEIFAVAGGANGSVFSRQYKTEVPPNVRFLGYVSDGEAKTLMRDCKGFLFPTIYEGFGIPPLEAMSAGAEAVVSDTEVMHEIYGDAAHYIDPMDYEADLSKIMTEISPEKKKEVLDKYSWKKSAKLLKKVCEICNG